MLKIITQLCMFLVGTLAPPPNVTSETTSEPELRDGSPIRAITLCPAIAPQHRIIESESIAYFEYPMASSQLKVEL
ncbi:hypothetical protein [Flavobacterium selenitireducens]|uniref:hypothetical protein n=1 Tax=Flavobacterium selenitireducens TaxID=2722704 RepID=UPI00168A9B36|nr:hypothetical protein [Flavobacterium selenitireducens]MBD3582508.1 hypothetical protein [Flavobacterium selenitireducens]